FASLRLNGIASSFRGSTAEQAVMPSWNWTGWFVTVVDQRGHKVGADRRLRSAQTAYRRRQKPQ
ncbi:MAG: hypothetical protein WCD54_23755, partial [Pseudolabrys sp.]